MRVHRLAAVATKNTERALVTLRASRFLISSLSALTQGVGNAGR